MRYVPSGFVNVLIAGPLGEIATTDARLTPEPDIVTRPEIAPVFSEKLGVGYNSEIPATSSVVRGFDRLVERVINVDITLEVKVCCKPNPWPIS